VGLAVSLIEFKWPSLGILGMGVIRSAQDVKYIVRISCSTKTVKNSNFDFPIKKNRQGNFKISSGELVYTCLTSDFFLEDADS
jgi:hypothetical protein